MGTGLRILGGISEVSASQWDALWVHEPVRATPFLSHAWLEALEHSGCVAPETGWRPRHLTLWRDGQLVAAAPAYAKRDSEGDFSRDWHWADAAERAGIRYYPKLVVGVPFTPAAGRRILVAPGEERTDCVEAIMQSARELVAAEGFGSLHVLYANEDDATELEAAGLALRVDIQYHWRNHGYRAPEDFLARFPSKRRNMVRRERAAPGSEGIDLRTVRGGELHAGAQEWARDLFRLQQAVVSRMQWGRVYVNEAFYQRVLERMPASLEVVEARRGGKLIATAFNVASRRRLYGRYWGCVEDHPFLHFNVCLYHSIDECIRRGLEAFEGGAGGEHKLHRGFEPAETWSAHAFCDTRLDAFLRRHLRDELCERRRAVARFRASGGVFKQPEPSRG